MRKHGWQLPYHPLQVVAIAVFLALGFGFYVFFAPFVGKQLFQYIAMGLYTPIIVCVFGLYIGCAAADPADFGVFRSKKYLHIRDNKNQNIAKSKHEGELRDTTPCIGDANEVGTQENNIHDQSKNSTGLTHDCNIENEKKITSFQWSYYLFTMLALAQCSCRDSADQEGSEDEMFYCSLCEVEVLQHSKHCRVCDKCVDCFDHHCRWINNCIGKKNYGIFFTLMVFALLMLILQWSTGILVLTLCFLDKKKFATDISYKLGSSFSVVPFAIVVVVCTLLAMVATLPIAQLFCFHVLLIKKGISTYDYIVALREQEKEAAEGQHSPQMSTVSSITGLSSTSSFNNFQRAAFCTPPRLFVEDQFDVIPPDSASVSSLGKRMTAEEPLRKKNTAPVRISPWMLARLNAEEVSRAAAEARKNSKILRPARRQGSSSALEIYSSFGSSSSRMALRPGDDKRRGSKHINLPIPEPTNGITIDHETCEDHQMITETTAAFQTAQTTPCLVSMDDYSSSPVSSLGSPEIRPLRASSSWAEDQKEIKIPLSRSNSDGYDASAGEDSDQDHTRILHRSVTWSIMHGSEHFKTALKSSAFV